MSTQVETWQAANNITDNKWRVDGNELLGSPCTWPAIPTALPSDTSAIDYAGLSLTGTIPTQLGLYTLVTSLSLANNTLSGEIPTGTFEGRKWAHHTDTIPQAVHRTTSFRLRTRRPPTHPSTTSLTHPSTTSLRCAAAELGALVLLDTTFSLASNDLTSTIPTGKYTLGEAEGGSMMRHALFPHSNSPPRPTRCHPFQSSASS